MAAAVPAWADDPADPSPGPPPAAELDGAYTYFIENSRFALWSITSTCDPAGNCFGHIVSTRKWTAPLTKAVGGPWTIQRDSPADGWVCPDGAPAPAHYAYSFDPATLAGTVIYTKAPGACGNPNTATHHDEISLSKV